MNSKASTLFLGGIFTIMLIFVLKETQAILMPFILAILGLYILDSILDAGEKIKIPRITSLIITACLTITLLILLSIQVSNFTNNLEGDKLIDTVQKGAEEVLSSSETSINEILDKITPGKKVDLKNLALQTTTNLSNDFPVGKIGQSTSLLVSFLLNTFGNILIATIIMGFLVNILISPTNNVNVKINKAFSSNPEKAQVINNVIENINEQIKEYLSIKTQISLLTAILVWIALWSLDVPFAGIWAMVTFLFNYIPNVGSAISILPPVLITIVDKGSASPLVVLIILIVIQFVCGSIIEPNMLKGSKMKLQPVVGIVSLLFWGWLWGMMGAIIAIPLTAIIKIIFDNIEPLKPIASLLSTD